MTDTPEDDCVVFLAFSSPETIDDGISLIGCSACGNKTFKLLPTPDDFTAMHCAACDRLIGRMGWVE